MEPDEEESTRRDGCLCDNEHLELDGFVKTEQFVDGEVRDRTGSRLELRCSQCGALTVVHRRAVGLNQAKHRLKMKRLERRFEAAEEAGDEKAMARIEAQAERLTRG